MSWKYKLEDEENLAGLVVADKSASWQKLNQRLQAGKNERLPVWSWIAAATVLLVISGAIFFQNNETRKALLPASTHPPSPRPKPDPSLPFTDTISTKQEMAGTVNEKQNLPGNQSVSLNPGRKPLTGKTEESSQPGLHEIQQPVVSIQVPEIENMQITEPILATVPKKKLKLVHINELNESSTTLRQYPLSEDFGVIRIRLNKRQVFTGTQPASATRNPPHIKPKIISTN